MTIRKFERELPVKLTEEEIIQRAKEQSKLELETIEAENEIQRIKKEAGGEIKELKEGLAEQRAVIRKFARAVRKGEEFRSVACEERLSDDSVHVETVRLDLNEVVDRRPATDADRQLSFDDQVDGAVESVARATEAADASEDESAEDEAADDFGLDDDDDDQPQPAA